MFMCLELDFLSNRGAVEETVQTISTDIRNLATRPPHASHMISLNTSIVYRGKLRRVVEELIVYEKSTEDVSVRFPGVSEGSVDWRFAGFNKKLKYLIETSKGFKKLRARVENVWTLY